MNSTYFADEDEDAESLGSDEEIEEEEEEDVFDDNDSLFDDEIEDEISFKARPKIGLFNELEEEEDEDYEFVIEDEMEEMEDDTDLHHLVVPEEELDEELETQEDETQEEEQEEEAIPKLIVKQDSKLQTQHKSPTTTTTTYPTIVTVGDIYETISKVRHVPQLVPLHFHR